MIADHRPGPIENARRLAYWVVALLFLMMFAIPPLAGFAVDYGSFMPFFGAAACFAPAALFAMHRGMNTARNTLEIVMLNFVLGPPTLVVNYCAMALGYPLADKSLAAMDAFLGIDVSRIVVWTDGRQLLVALLAIAYTSFSYQLMILAPVMALLGYGGRAFRFVSAFLLVDLVSSAIAAFFPSLGAFDHFGLTRQNLSAIDTRIGYEFMRSFMGVRGDPHFILSLNNAAGIVTFPSVHAAVATLCAWLAWRSPLLRWPLLALNLAMTFSAISHGAHYFVDVVAGVAVALVSLAVVDAALARIAFRGLATIRPARAVPTGAIAAR